MTAVAVPLALGSEPGAEITSIGAHGLMYGLPWALAILIVCCADLAAASAASAVVVLHLALAAARRNIAQSIFFAGLIE